jgi:aryl-alcohol dehydrogenase-like predicted oxidoreductase
MPQARLALSWLLHDRRVSAVIVGSRNTTQLAESLHVANWDMEQSAWERLNKASRIDHGYPLQWMDLAVPATFSDYEKL